MNNSETRDNIGNKIQNEEKQSKMTTLATRYRTKIKKPKTGIQHRKLIRGATRTQSKILG